MAQKAILARYLFTQSHAYDIVHYLFTPTALNSALITHLTYRRPKTIQTIATLREDLYGPADWKKMFFADQLVAYSDYSKTRLEKAGFANVTRIYPGIDLTLYSPQPKDQATMEHFRITPDDFVLSYFCAGSTSQTLSLYILSMLRSGISPIVNALTAVMLLFSSLLVLLFFSFSSKNRARIF